MRHHAVCALLTIGTIARLWFACPSPLHAAQYTAFSLKVAQQRIERAPDDWRQREPEVLSLGGINRVEGFVYDQPNGDLILVGEHDETRAALTLDDLVVALRARFRYSQWPLVSIDSTPETPKTQMQHVRWEGGIQETAFGQALFEADYRLKEMGMGLLATGVPGLRTGWDRDVEESDSGAITVQRQVNSRLWFYPINPHVVVREGVCVVRGLKVGVFTEVLSATVNGKPVEDVKSYKSATTEAWARDVNDRFDDLCRTQPSFNRLRGLQELVAVSKALEELEESPDLGWWLEKYPVVTVPTPKEAKFLKRRYDGKRGSFEVSGGVHLTALAMRLNAGDVGALRDAVLKTRPAPDTPNWGFVAGEWIIPIGAGEVKPDDLAPLFQQAVFLLGQQRFADAVSLCEQILGFNPRSAEGWCYKGVALSKLARYEEELSCYDRALEIAPRLAEAWCNKGAALLGLGRTEGALACFDRALEINPRLAGAHVGIGSARLLQGNAREAVTSYNGAVGIDPSNVDGLIGRAIAYASLGEADIALRELAKVTCQEPGCARAWFWKAQVMFTRGLTWRALECLDRAARLDPKYARNRDKALEMVFGHVRQSRFDVSGTAFMRRLF